MKRNILLAGMLLPLAGYPQSTDSTVRQKLTTTSPRSGGITVSYLVAPVTIQGSTFTIQQPTADMGFPLYRQFRSAHPILLRTGIRYQGLLLSNESQIGVDNFHSITVPLLFSYSFTRATSISLVGTAGVGSDFKRSIEGEDILYTAGVRLGLRQNKRFRFAVTVAYVRNYAGKLLLPMPDIDWTISKRWSLTGILPARVSLKYKMSAAQSLGLTASISGSMYRLNEGGKEQYLHLRQNTGGLIYELKLAERWRLNLVAGHTFMQRLETFNMDQKIGFNKFGDLNNRVANVSYNQNSFIFQGGLSYQF